MQAKCFAYHFLGGFDVALPPRYRPSWHMTPIPRPKDGLRVTLAPRC
jgi:hypothetical protein